MRLNCYFGVTNYLKQCFLFTKKHNRIHIQFGKPQKKLEVKHIVSYIAQHTQLRIKDPY